MTQIRKKQKKLFTIMRIAVIFTAVVLFVYIGAKPYVIEFNEPLSVVMNYFCDIIVIFSLVITFLYYSKYGKIDYILTCAEDEINDNGCYLTSRKCSDFQSYKKELENDFSDSKFTITQNVQGNDFNFDLRAYKGKEYFYLACINELDSNDILAYLDEGINDITVKNLKRKGDAVICFITERADESAVALSKMITPIGRKNQLKTAIAIVELTTSKVYFNGSKNTKYKRLIAEFVMNCELPIKDKFIVKEKLPFQYELSDKLERVTLKDLKSDNFYLH